jgi:hypothetical protein
MLPSQSGKYTGYFNFDECQSYASIGDETLSWDSRLDDEDFLLLWQAPIEFEIKKEYDNLTAGKIRVKDDWIWVATCELGIELTCERGCLVMNCIRNGKELTNKDRGGVINRKKGETK